mmetsp:Transcript_76525/g.247652  ORF Transcript_76525/g.247652 Transcript_76525/m.247652 type:complete len:368 (+) Transcript_76525:133-1236(+)
MRQGAPGGRGRRRPRAGWHVELPRAVAGAVAGARARWRCRRQQVLQDLPPGQVLAQRPRRLAHGPVHGLRVQGLLQVQELPEGARAARLHGQVRGLRDLQLPPVLLHGTGLSPDLHQDLALRPPVYVERLLHGPLPLDDLAVQLLELEALLLLVLAHAPVRLQPHLPHTGLLPPARAGDLVRRPAAGHVREFSGLLRAGVGGRHRGVAPELHVAVPGVSLHTQLLHGLLPLPQLDSVLPALRCQHPLQRGDALLVLGGLLHGGPVDVVDLAHGLQLRRLRRLLREVTIGLHGLRRLPPPVHLGILLRRDLPPPQLGGVPVGLHLPHDVAPAVRLWHHGQLDGIHRVAAIPARHGACCAVLLVLSHAP